MDPADARLLRIVKLRVVVTMLVQLLHALSCARPQIIESTKDDRFCGANFGASWNESALLSVIAKRALECAAGVGQRLRSTIDHAEWTRDDAVTTAVANIVLNED